jgi:hypothetical protein
MKPIPKEIKEELKQEKSEGKKRLTVDMGLGHGDKFHILQPSDSNQTTAWVRGKHNVSLTCPVATNERMMYCHTDCCPLWSNAKETCKLVYLVDKLLELFDAV